MRVGLRHDDLRRRNRAMVIAAIRRGGQPSRTEIASTTALSHSTISTIAADLIGEGVLEEARGGEVVALKRGRPQVALALNPQAGAVVAVVLSLNALSAALIDYCGNEIAVDVSRPSTLTMARDELAGTVIAAISRLLAGAAHHGPVLRMTVAIQGITDAAARKLLWSPITPHSDVELAQALEAAFAIPVTVENDCNMIAVALRARRPERYSDNFAAILLSNGIGMGLVLRGEAFAGPHSSGGEFGHMIHVPDGALCRCGRRGCIEAYAGNYAILRHARGQSERAEPAADIDHAVIMAIADEARAGPGRAREAFHRAGEAIGFGLGDLFALIDPVPVAIVGPGTGAFDVIEKPLREALSRTAGGQNAAASFELEPDEMPLIREGAAYLALTFLDRETFAAGPPAQASRMA